MYPENVDTRIKVWENEYMRKIMSNFGSWLINVGFRVRWHAERSNRKHHGVV
jgi:hypothetical protein